MQRPVGVHAEVQHCRGLCECRHRYVGASRGPRHGGTAASQLTHKVCGEEPGLRGGLVDWVGSRLAPKVVTHGQCAHTSLARLGTPLWLSGLTAVQTADDPRTSSRR